MGRRILQAMLVVSLLLLAASAFAGGGGEGDKHGDAHGGHGVGEINWYHGLVAEREGVEPSLLWREKGTPRAQPAPRSATSRETRSSQLTSRPSTRAAISRATRSDSRPS